MQVLSDLLEKSLLRDGGTLSMRHTVEHIQTKKQQSIWSQSKEPEKLAKPG